MNKAKIIKTSKIISIVSLFVLIILLLIFSIFYTNNSGVAILALVFPLLFPIRGILTGNRYAFAYSSLLSIWYFILTTYLYTDPLAEYRYIMLIAAIFSFLWFCCCLCHNKLTKPAKIKSNNK